MIKVSFLQINNNWCLPFTEAYIRYGYIEKIVMSVIVVLVGLFFLYKIIQNHKQVKTSGWRFDLLKNPTLYRLVKSKYFLFSIRVLPFLLFVFVIATGILGRKYTSLAAGFTWVFWWTALIYFVAFLGNVFCTICPWDFLANLIQFNGISFFKRKAQGFMLKWPKSLSNIYPAIVLFILFTWLELGFEITRNSYLTSMLGLAMLFMAVLFALIFEKRVFCRYLCLVGRVSGIYSQFSPIELRKKEDEVCKNCKTKECITGTETAEQCPTFEKPFLLKENTNCSLCTECIRACNKNNLTIKARPFAVDFSKAITRKDEDMLVYVLLLLTFFHGITMTKNWYDWTSYVENILSVNYTLSFSILMTLFISISYLFLKLYFYFCQKISSTNYSSSSFSLVFIPIALAYHLGHNSMHLFVETAYLTPVLNDPFGFGWNIFGLEDLKIKPFLEADALRYLQLVIVAIGFYFAVKVLYVRLCMMSDSRKEKTIVFLCYYVLLLSLHFLSVWFIYKPMIMKSAGV